MARGWRPEVRTKTGDRQPLFAWASPLFRASLEREKWCLAPVFVTARSRPSGRPAGSENPAADQRVRPTPRAESGARARGWVPAGQRRDITHAGKRVQAALSTRGQRRRLGQRSLAPFCAPTAPLARMRHSPRPPPVTDPDGATIVFTAGTAR